MGILIKSVGTSLDSYIQSSIAHATLAGKRCLRSVGVLAEDVSLLFNVGIYRDSNIVEPAVAALIQKELAMNGDYLKSSTLKATASFDLMNGPCGALNAVQVASAFLMMDPQKLALIVSSDVHPAQMNQAHPGQSEFPYASIGAAVLLEHSPDPQKGFGIIQTRTSQEQYLGMKGYTELFKKGSRYQVNIQQTPEYSLRLMEFMAESVIQYGEMNSIDLHETLIISSQIESQYLPLFARKIGVSVQSLFQISGIAGNPYSSTLALGYSQAMSQQEFQSYQQSLFILGGTGLTSCCALYRL